MASKIYIGFIVAFILFLTYGVLNQKKMIQKQKELLVKRVLQHLKKFIKKIFKKQKSY